MGIKAPSCMTGLASAANTFGQSVKKAGVAAYNKLDRCAEKRPLVAAVGGLAMILLGVSGALVLPVSSVLVAAGAGMFGLGLKHLIRKPPSFDPKTPYSWVKNPRMMRTTC